LLEAASTPEQRLALAGAIDCSYADLTNWMIRADLLRIEGLDAEAAAALAAAGMVGVRDPAAWTGEARRLDQLDQKLFTVLPVPRARVSVADLKLWGERAARLAARVITDTAPSWSSKAPAFSRRTRRCACF
jgi:Domain of unknown function (DUF4332)